MYKHMNRIRQFKVNGKWGHDEVIEERSITTAEYKAIIDCRFKGDRYYKQWLGGPTYKIVSTSPSGLERVIYLFS